MLPEPAVAGLERSCAGRPGAAATGDWLRSAPPAPGLQRAEARFAGHAFAPHRHDSYAIGTTLQGVQSFSYRGSGTHSLPGQAFVLHPDERHDGRAGTGAGFRYRILYLDPWAVAEALGQGPLPFVPDAVARHQALQAAVAAAFEDPDLPLEPLALDRVVLALAEGLAIAAGARAAMPRVLHRQAVQRARDCLDAHVAGGVDSATLERASGLSRFALARHFRACLGTSPHRYLVQRRLDLVRRLVAEGMGLAAAAVEAGFADQSHMTRHFRRSYGIAPGRWLALARGRAGLDCSRN